ncbi:MAG: hypothetical protein ACYCOR_16810 [Acidobacteriaceae bacterium]
MITEHNGPRRVEDDIDAALKMLGETQPPAAIVSRVHQRLEAAAMSQRARSGRWFWVPAAGAAMAAILFMIFSQAHWARRSSPVESARMVTVAPSRFGRAATQPALIPEGDSAVRSVSAQPVIRRRRRQERPEYRHVANLLSYPMTRQEKLLVQFAKTAKPADLQALNPEYQAKVEAQQEAEFAAYLKSGSGSSEEGTAEAAETN